MWEKPSGFCLIPNPKQFYFRLLMAWVNQFRNTINSVFKAREKRGHYKEKHKRKTISTASRECNQPFFVVAFVSPFIRSVKETRLRSVPSISDCSLIHLLLLCQYALTNIYGSLQERFQFSTNCCIRDKRNSCRCLSS